MALGLLNIPRLIDLEEDEEEADSTPPWMRTEEPCASCGESIGFTDEVYLIQIEYAQQSPNGPELHIMQCNDGDYLFEPYFLHIECWEDILSELKDKVNDVPPSIHPEGVLECCMCGSSILLNEYLGTATIGEIHLSDRRPNDQSSTKFKPNGHPDVYCLHCIALINEEELEMWEGLNQNGECITCTNVRCWRNVTCHCMCHIEEKI